MCLFYFFDYFFDRIFVSPSFLTGHFLLQSLIKTCLFSRGLFCTDHLGAFGLIFFEHSCVRLLFIFGCFIFIFFMYSFYFYHICLRSLVLVVLIYLISFKLIKYFRRDNFDILYYVCSLI